MVCFFEGGEKPPFYLQNSMRRMYMLFCHMCRAEIFFLYKIQPLSTITNKYTYYKTQHTVSTHRLFKSIYLL